MKARSGYQLGADGYFQTGGRRFVPAGVNYWPASCGVEQWQAWPAAEIQADLDLVRSLGLNTVRFFLRWQDFEPRPGRYDRRMWTRLSALLGWCVERGLAAHPSFFVGWMSGGIFWPAWKGSRNLFADPWMVRRAEAFAERAARICSRHAAGILAVDLGNELCCLPESSAAPAAAVEAWCRRIRAAIRRGLPHAVVVTGNEQMQVTADTGWRLGGQGACEVGSMHTYPNPAWHSIGFDGMTDPLGQSLLPFYLKCARAFGPVFAQEFGTLFTAGRGAADYLRAVLPAAWAAGANGFLWWCLRDIAAPGHPYDKNPFEGGLGLVDDAGRPKPRLRPFLTFAASLARRAAPSSGPWDAALYWPSEYYPRDNPGNPGNQPAALSQRMIVAHFTLAALGLTVGIARGDRPFSEIRSRLLVIPGALLTAPEIAALADWVRRGGRVIWHGVEATTFGPATAALLGADPVDFYAPAAEGVRAFGRTWTFRAFPRGIWAGAAATSARVVARDRRGRPLVLQHRLGRGMVAACLADPDAAFAADAARREGRSHWRRWYQGMIGLTRRSALAGLVAAGLCSAASALAQVAPDLAVAAAGRGPGVTWISIRPAAAPRANPWPSIYVNPKLPGATAARGGWDRIAGARLAAPGGPLRVDLHASAGARYYGSGNAQPALLHRAGRSGVGNGVATIPYYFSTDGYAVLVVGRDDRRPANWTCDPGQPLVHWEIPGAGADFYVGPARNLAEAARAYGKMSGCAPAPPRWALGYLQSRWGWTDPAEVSGALARFRRDHIPVDAFIFDFEWYTAMPDYRVPAEGVPGFSDFDWNPALFPDPARQLGELRRAGVRFVGIRKPRLGNAQTLANLRERGWLLAAPAGEAKRERFEARDLDFAVPAARAWYGERMAPLLKQGVDGWWNDEGEASFVNYFWWNEAECAEAGRLRPDRRFWSLNRAFQPGLQRLGAAAWTGDIDSTWASLAATPASLLNWSLAGMPYCGCDIGGFKGEDSPELLARWIEAGVFFPVMRTHSTRMVKPRFPWLYGPEAERAIRRAIELRYRLLPLLATLADETARTGLPPMRPLAMVFPDDPECRERTDEWMLGDRLLAAPLLDPGGRRQVYLPPGEWFRFGTSERLAGGRSISVRATLEEIPIFVRAGTILPLGPVVESTAQAPGGPLEVQVYPGGSAEFALVEDDGESLAYQRGQVRTTTFRWNEGRRELTWRRQGGFDGPSCFRSCRIRPQEGESRATPPLALSPQGAWSGASP